jgi:DNA-binding NarL/FixJ family response regulator
MEMRPSTVFILDPKNLRRAGMVELLRSWAENARVSLADMPAAPPPFPAKAGECRMVIVNLGNVSVNASSSQRLIQGVRGHLPLAPLVLISDRENSEEIVSAVQAGASGFIPTNTEPDLAIRALTFIMDGGSFFPPTALIDLQDGMWPDQDDDDPNPDGSGPPRGGHGPLNILKPSGLGLSNERARSRKALGTSLVVIPAHPYGSGRRFSSCRPGSTRTCRSSSSTQQRDKDYGKEAWKDYGEVFRLGNADR